MESGVKRPTREVPRTTGKVTPTLERTIVLPLEGKGDRSAVDEVNIRPAPLREASIDYGLLTPASLFPNFLKNRGSILELLRIELRRRMGAAMTLKK